MTDSRRTDEARSARPLSEPGRERPGADVGGIAANADGGLQDALQRRTERRDDDPTGATIGSASAGGREPRLDLGGKAEPGSAAGAPAPDRSSAGSPTAGHPAVAAGAAGAGREGDATKDASERGNATRSASSGSRTASDAATPRSGGVAAGSTHPSSGRTASGNQGAGTVTHDPDEPPDEGPIESLGRAVSEVVTAPVQDRDEHDPNPPPRRR